MSGPIRIKAVRVLLSKCLENLRRELFDPQWWVCEWWHTNGLASGSMPVFGSTREQAFAHAERFLEYVTDGEVMVRIRRPNAWERIGAAWRTIA